MSELEPLGPEKGVEQYLDSRRSSVRDSTYSNDQTRLRYFLEFLDEEEIEDLNDISGRDLNNFVAWRRADIAPITLQKQLSTIRTFLRWAADVEAVQEGLAEKVHAPELPDGAEARDIHLSADHADAALDHLATYKYAHGWHVVLAILWRTGMRRSALRALDVDDLRPEKHAVDVQHRPETGTALKNGSSGERWVFLGPRWFQVVDDYVADVRPNVVDEHGRRPLVATVHGRATESCVQSWCYAATRPCHWGGCPHEKNPETCEAARRTKSASKCPSTRSPHAVRRGAITSHLLEEVPPEVVSERMDVSLEVLYRHYDARTKGEKMAQRRQFL